MAEAAQTRTWRAALGLPEGPSWLWLFFVAPALQVVGHVDGLLGLSSWFQGAIARWREITHRLWADLIAALNLNIQLDAAELDALTLSALCLLAALGSLVRNQRAPLHNDVMAAYTQPLGSRILTFAVIALTATAYFGAFVGRSIYYYGAAYLGEEFVFILFAGYVAAAIALVSFLLFAQPLLQRVRIELLLTVSAIVLAAILIGSTIVSDGGTEPLLSYLRLRGLNPLAYPAIVLALALTILAVLWINWRALPAILAVCGLFIIADRTARALQPAADYLRSL